MIFNYAIKNIIFLFIVKCFLIYKHTTRGDFELMNTTLTRDPISLAVCTRLCLVTLATLDGSAASVVTRNVCARDWLHWGVFEEILCRGETEYYSTYYVYQFITWAFRSFMKIIRKEGNSLIGLSCFFKHDWLH